MRKLRAGLMGLLSTLVLVAGLGLVPGSPAEATVQPPDGVCYEQVVQTKWERTTRVDQHRYEKFVKGERRKNQQRQDFDWIDYPGAGPLAWGEIPNPMSGPHNSQWDGPGGWRYYSERYQYQIVDTRQIDGLVENSGWINGTNKPSGSGWVKVGERTVNGAEIPCPNEDVAITVEVDCEGITIISEKDISNIVYGTSASSTKAESGLGVGTTNGFIPIDRSIEAIWVKAGHNPELGDGDDDPMPVQFNNNGTGQYFAIAWPSVKDCTTQPDPETDQRVDCETSEMVSYETPYVWDEQLQDYVPGDEIETGRRAATPAELNEAECPGPDQPNPEEREVSIDEVNCETEMVETWTTYFETPYVYDEATRTWVLGVEEQVGEPVKTAERPATIEELNEAECPPSEQPDPTPRQTVTEQLSCENRNVTVTTTYFETPKVWDEATRTWVDGDEVQVGQTVEVRAATDAELEDCPTTTTTTPPAGKLPVTGGDSISLVQIGVILLAVGALALVAVRGTRKTTI